MPMSPPTEPRARLPVAAIRVRYSSRRRATCRGADGGGRGDWSGGANRGADRPAGTRYDLDGRFVTDVEGFYCAIGEAINGPGGYFGLNLDALDDCLSGGV